MRPFAWLALFGVTSCVPAPDHVALSGMDPAACRVEKRGGHLVWSMGAYTGHVGGQPATIVHLGIDGAIAEEPMLTVYAEGGEVPLDVPSFVHGVDYYYVLPPTIAPERVAGFVARWDGLVAIFGVDPLIRTFGPIAYYSPGQYTAWRGEQTPWLYRSWMPLRLCQSQPRKLAASDRQLPALR
jgi:hypothetical protein